MSLGSSIVHFEMQILENQNVSRPEGQNYKVAKTCWKRHNRDILLTKCRSDRRYRMDFRWNFYVQFKNWAYTLLSFIFESSFKNSGNQLAIEELHLEMGRVSNLNQSKN